MVLTRGGRGSKIPKIRRRHMYIPPYTGLSTVSYDFETTREPLEFFDHSLSEKLELKCNDSSPTLNLKIHTFNGHAVMQ